MCMSWVLNPNKAGLFEGSFSGRGVGQFIQPHKKQKTMVSLSSADSFKEVDLND